MPTCVHMQQLLTIILAWSPTMLNLFNISIAGIRQCFDVMTIDDDIPEDTEDFMFTFDTAIDPEAQNSIVTLTPRILEVEITDNDEGK